MEELKVKNVRYSVSKVFGKMHFTKLHSVVKKHHDAFMQPEVHHAAGRKGMERYGVALL